MRKLYEKNEIGFALVWIGLYVVLMNIALQFCGGLDDLAGKTAEMLIVPVAMVTVLTAAALIWILRSGTAEKYGLCRFRGSWKGFLFFLPLIVFSLVNFSDGVGLNAPLAVSLLMMANMAIAGLLEEIIFRGFLFRAMAKSDLRSAVIVSAVTFGAGHVVNLLNTDDVLGVLLQMAYAVTVGFMFVAIVFKGGSLWPCIISHMVVNGSSVFALEQGPFTQLIASLTGSAAAGTVQAVSAALVMIISGGYALWLWEKA